MEHLRRSWRRAAHDRSKRAFFEPGVTSESNRIDVVRGDVVESSHRVHLAVVNAEGTRLVTAGDAGRLTYFRSSAKPLQALPLVEDGVDVRWGLSAEDLALCCASHGGEPAHVEGVRALLAKVGVPETALACGAHLPMHVPSAHRLIQDGGQAERIHNNCSGKHAGMLALAKHHGWPLEGYQAHAHPVQRRMLSEVSRWTGADRDAIQVGVDGCGVSCFGLSVEHMAQGYARFAEAARTEGGARTIVRAMTRHPWCVAGTGRLCTMLMEAMDGRAFVKVGAEGVYGAGIPERGWGVALKVEDGGWRGAEVALMSVFEQLALLPAGAGVLASFRPVRLHNTCGEEVGYIVSRLQLEVQHA